MSEIDVEQIAGAYLAVWNNFQHLFTEAGWQRVGQMNAEQLHQLIEVFA